MSPSKYREQRLDPRWQKMRLQVMERDSFKCVECESEDKTLNVHHSYYVKGRMPWQYPMFSLSTLCQGCHKQRHAENDEEFVLSEWEQEMDWMLGGNGENSGAAWHLAGIVAQIIAAGFSATAAYGALEKSGREILALTKRTE